MSNLTDDQLQQLNQGVQQWVTKLSGYLSETTATQSLPILGNLAPLIATEQGELTTFGQTLSNTINQAILEPADISPQSLVTLLNAAFQQAGISASTLNFTSTGQGIQLSLDASLTRSFSQNLPSDLGLGPLVTLSSSPTLQAHGGAELKLVCGLDTGGFYLDGNDGQSSLKLTANASLPHTPLSGTVGLLNATLTPNQAALDATLELGLGTSDSTSSGLLRTNNLGTLAITPVLSGDLAIDLAVATSVKRTIDGTSVNILPLTSSLGVAWDLGTQTTPDISLTDSHVALGPLLQTGGIVQTILQSMARTVSSLKPVFDCLTKELPLLNNASLLEVLASSPLVTAEQKQQAAEFIQLVQHAYTFIADLPTSYSTATLTLPDFSVAGVTPEPLPYQSEGPLSSPVLTELPTPIGALSGALSDFLDKISTDSFGTLSLPVLSEPGSLAGLLFGINTDLAKWDLPSIDISKEVNYGPLVPVAQYPSLSIGLTGAASFRSNLGIGYDATGILDYKESKKAAELVDGLYLYNTAGSNASPLTANLSIKPNLNLGIGESSITLSGGTSLRGSILLYPDNIGSPGHTHLFVAGKQLPSFAARASLNASLDVDVTSLGITHKFSILPPTQILSFIAPVGSPEYGPGEHAGADIQLHIGDNFSKSGQDRDPLGESLKINHLPSLKEGETRLSLSLDGEIATIYTITANGSLTGSATSGKIMITESPLINTPIHFHGGDADLTFVGGVGNDHLTMDDGDNVLTPGGGHNSLSVGDGNNLIYLGLGKDDVSAGSNTAISFEKALKPLTLDLTASTAHGCAEGDRLNGDFTSVTGTGLKDRITGGYSPITLIGGRGNDLLQSGSADTTLIGVNPASAYPGRREVDTLVGAQCGNTVLFALGDAANVYYDSGKIRGGGKSDYALIKNFDPGQDLLQLHGDSSKYLTGVTTLNGRQGLGIYFDSQSDGHLTPNSELIAIIQPDGTHALGDLNYSNTVGQARFV